jgi:hypothetical protein
MPLLFSLEWWAMATLSGYKRLAGRSERFLEIATGKEISRRAYDKIRRGISNEELAKINRKFYSTEHALRPARGRKSGFMYAPAVREDIAKARIEERERIEKEKKAEKERKKIERAIERQKNKKLKTIKRFNKNMLKPGTKARRFLFYTYEEYVDLYNQMKKSGVVLAYSLGVYGVNEQTGETMAAFVIPMRDFGKRPISEAHFSELDEWAEEHSYFILLGYMIQAHFKKDFYESHAIAHGITPKYQTQTEAYLRAKGQWKKG